MGTARFLGFDNGEYEVGFGGEVMGTARLWRFDNGECEVGFGGEVMGRL